uniref:Uncharacterized protein n=1 Tax=Timema cristinae TaxID=61476 RepID=A0A7R9CIG9_TIMCR|nr:unnamed protein product [Timema cristinae]
MERLPYIQNEQQEWKQSLLLPASFLLVSVLGSIGMAAGSVVILAPEDRISIARGAWLSLLGLVFFVSLFDLLNYVALRTHIGHMFRKKYELTLVEVLDISNKQAPDLDDCYPGQSRFGYSLTPAHENMEQKELNTGTSDPRVDYAD